MDRKGDEFYKKLRDSLMETTKFPTNYMFKFIIPNKLEQKKQINNLFALEGAIVKTNTSKSKKFISFTILQKMNTVEDILAKYKEASNIKDIISL